MTLHFTREEFAERRRRVLAAMAARGQDALLMFKQEKCGSSAFLRDDKPLINRHL
jgi:hypothetical protein